MNYTSDHATKNQHKCNAIRESEYDASINTDHAKFIKKIEARTVHKTNKGLEFKNDHSQKDKEVFDGLNRICQTIGLGCGSLYLLSKVWFIIAQMCVETHIFY